MHRSDMPAGTPAVSFFPRHLIPPCAATFQLSIPSPSPPPPSSRFYSSPSSGIIVLRRHNSDTHFFIKRATNPTTEGFWEDPDDGFESDSVEFEEEKIGEAQNDTATIGSGNSRYSSAEYERLVEEVEQLLEPEEKEILQHNEVSDISKTSTKKWSTFHSLGLSLQIPLMDELLDRGCDIDVVDKDGHTALHKAVIGKKEAVISHLLRKGANPLVRDRDGATALHYAVQAGAMQTIKLLIKYKVDVNAADNDGWTPLHISMQIRSRDIAKVLLVNGADQLRRNKDGKTPVDLSLCYGRDFKSYDLAKLLKLVPANRNI
ncbi:hypothetical protein KSP40_PGU005157 [Platanthera guangdongensis]|uniref:Ankyrin repeat domain-containing protein EMB506, chloroplastic n=1 Tax=Platanthera guangdongensis TaxID=2320717 RepID=A0ABR2M0T5_9ASPA